MAFSLLIMAIRLQLPQAAQPSKSNSDAHGPNFLLFLRRRGAWDRRGELVTASVPLSWFLWQKTWEQCKHRRIQDKEYHERHL